MMTTNEIKSKADKMGIDTLSKKTSIPEQRLSLLMRKPIFMTSDERMKIEDALNVQINKNNLESVGEKAVEMPAEKMPVEMSTEKESVSPKLEEKSGKAEETLAETENKIPEKNRNFSIKLKKLMNKKRMTSSKLILKSGLCAQSIYSYMNGTVYPRKKSRDALVRALDVPYSVLFGDDENKKKVVNKVENVKKSEVPDDNITTEVVSIDEAGAIDVKPINTGSAPSVKRLSPEIQRMILTFSDGSLLIVRGTSNAIEIDYECVSDQNKSFKRKEDLHKYINANKYLKYLKIKILQNLFLELGIPEKDFGREIAIIADL